MSIAKVIPHTSSSEYLGLWRSIQLLNFPYSTLFFYILVMQRVIKQLLLRRTHKMTMLCCEWSGFGPFKHSGTQKGEPHPHQIFLKGEIPNPQPGDVSYTGNQPSLQRFFTLTPHSQWNDHKLSCDLCRSRHTHSCFWQDSVPFQLFFPQGSVLGSVPSTVQWIRKWHEKGSAVRRQRLLMIWSYPQEQSRWAGQSGKGLGLATDWTRQHSRETHQVSQWN